MARILVTGANGLLAHALRERCAGENGVVFLTRRDFDLTNLELMAQKLRDTRPEIVINTAAYNLVDRCEVERDLSWAVNAAGPKILAQLCSEMEIRLVHYGSDYVFDGTKQRPYTEEDLPKPLNHYGRGKLFGEEAVLGAAPWHLVLRTSWIFGPHPTQKKSYIHTVLRQALAGSSLKATTDQISIPTYAPDLAGWTYELIRSGANGLFHAVNDEPVSRFEWTQLILEEAAKTGLLISGQAVVEPVTTDYFKPPMPRPAYSVLDNTKASQFLRRSMGSWRTGLSELMSEISEGVGALKKDANGKG